MKYQTLENYWLCVQVLGKIAVNFWPMIILLIGYFFWDKISKRNLNTLS